MVFWVPNDYFPFKYTIIHCLEFTEYFSVVSSLTDNMLTASQYVKYNKRDQ